MPEQSPNPATIGNAKPSAPLLPVALKSTEFWLVLLVIVALAAETFAGVLPAELAAKLMIVSAGLYKLLRFILKWRAASYQMEVALAEIDARTEREMIIGPDASGAIRTANTEQIDTSKGSYVPPQTVLPPPPPPAKIEEKAEYQRGVIDQPSQLAGGGFRNQEGSADVLVIGGLAIFAINLAFVFALCRDAQKSVPVDRLELSRADYALAASPRLTVPPQGQAQVPPSWNDLQWALRREVVR